MRTKSAAIVGAMSNFVPCVLASLIAGVASLGFADMASAQDKPVERTVTVSATGTVSAEPDIVHVSTGVVAEAETAREALTRNSALMKKVVDGLKSAGVAAADIQTTALEVEPRYAPEKDRRQGQIIGYRVSNQVRITSRDIARLGEILDQVVTLGANRINAIQFEVSRAEELKDEARRQAMANARRRAELYATGAGAEVGQVLTISEDGYVGGPVPRQMMKSAAAEAIPIERGSQMLEVRVNVTWALK